MTGGSNRSGGGMGLALLALGVAIALGSSSKTSSATTEVVTPVVSVPESAFDSWTQAEIDEMNTLVLQLIGRANGTTQ